MESNKEKYCSIINVQCPYNHDDCSQCHLYVVAEETKQKAHDMKKGYVT